MELLLAEFRHFIIALSVLVPSALVNALLLRSYHRPESEKTSEQKRGLMARGNFSPLDLGGFSYGRLALVSVLSLFLELLMIRWVSSEVRVFAYFKNFVLVACFLGFGVGCYLCRRRINVFALIVPLLSLAVLIKWPWERLRFLMTSLPVYIGVLSDVYIWGVPHLKLGFYSISVTAFAIALVVVLFGLVAFVFIPFGQLVGWYLENSPNGVFSYSVNIAGSLVGIGLYTLLCYRDESPDFWFAVAGAMLVAYLWRERVARWTTFVAFLICITLAHLGPPPPSKTYWSPYQKLTLTPDKEEGSNEISSYDLNTNDAWYQKIIDLSPNFVAAHPELFAKVPAEWNAYNLPYKFYPEPKQVLVLGAGMGNDVAAALRHSADEVVAVEIDPLILKLGSELHFERPYSSSKVVVVVDDARSFLQNNRQSFDLIMFSLLDSHTNTSNYSNIRIDNYVYTLEAMKLARRALKPDGLLIVKFQVDTPWIAGRLQELLKEVFLITPVQIQSDAGGYTTEGRFFIVGSQQRVSEHLAEPAIEAYYATHRNFTIESAIPTTDDWPYFYQRERGIPAAVAIVCAVILLFGLLFLRETGISYRFLNWHFFFLGAGFMLLESQIVSKMALLFGTTWMVNSIVIAGLMLLIIAANVLVEWSPDVSVGIAYAGIFASMLVAYVVPMRSYFFSLFWLKAMTATAVLSLPVFFAGIVFIRSFASAGFQGTALGSNLLGALVGGLLESLSYWTGIRSLLVVAALLYLASVITRSSKARVTPATT